MSVVRAASGKQFVTWNVDDEEVMGNYSLSQASISKAMDDDEVSWTCLESVTLKWNWKVTHYQTTGMDHKSISVMNSVIRKLKCKSASEKSSTSEITH